MKTLSDENDQEIAAMTSFLNDVMVSVDVKEVREILSAKSTTESRLSAMIEVLQKEYDVERQVESSASQNLYFKLVLTHTGAEPDIFIWGATGGASFATRGAVNGLCRTFRKRPKFWEGHCGSQEKFWGGSGPPGTPQTCVRDEAVKTLLWHDRSSRTFGLLPNDGSCNFCSFNRLDLLEIFRLSKNGLC